MSVGPTGQQNGQALRVRLGDQMETTDFGTVHKRMGGCSQLGMVNLLASYTSREPINLSEQITRETRFELTQEKSGLGSKQVLSKPSDWALTYIGARSKTLQATTKHTANAGMRWAVASSRAIERRASVEETRASASRK